MLRKIICAVGVAVLSAASLLADFQYQETTRITGGALAGMMKFAGAFSKRVNEPMTSSVYVKGNRMAHINAHTGSIIDLDKETITTIDFEKKTYSVMTFAQMKQAYQDAMAKLKEQHPQQKDGANVDLSIKASVKETGKTRDISGYSTKGYIMTLMMEGKDQQSGQSGAMGVTSDMWMAPDIAGYQEVRDFYRRMGEKLGMMMGGGIMDRMQLMQPQLGEGLLEAAKEMSKMKGIPVLTVMRMGGTPNGQPLPAASEAPEAAKSEGPSAGDVAGQAAGNAAGNSIESRLGHLGGLGGLGGFGHKKKQDDQQPHQDQTQAQNGQQAGGILIESTTESSGFSSAAVDASKFETPAGFKEVQPDIERRGGRGH
jgi:hypothetical protein